MKNLPRLARPGRQPCLLAGLFLGLTMSFVLASSAAASDAWPYEWRPNWIPGDPVASRVGASWIAFEQVAPGLIVALDPVTRLPVRPSAAQRAAAAALFEEGRLVGPPDEMLPTERIPSGGELIHLHGRFDVFSVARRGADGRFVTDCSPDPIVVGQKAQQPRAERRGEER